MKDFMHKFTKCFNPETLKQNLTIASLFIAVFDNFKSSIINKVKDFYISGFDENGYIYHGYEKNVLNKVSTKKNRDIRATLLWLKEHNMINDNDISQFEEFTKMRNKLAHEMTNMLLEGFPEEIYDLYFEMIKMFDRIERQWCIDIEIPINPPEISPEDILWDEITSLNIEFIKIMTDIAFTGNDKYMHLVNEYMNKH